MIINNISSRTGPVSFTVTGSGSSQEVKGKLQDNGYAVVDPPGQAPYTVDFDTSIHISDIARADAIVTRLLGDRGWELVQGSREA